MDRQCLTQFFRRSDLVTISTAKIIAETFSFKEIKKNEFLLRENTLSNEYFYLEHGFMRSFAFDVDGNDITTNFYIDDQVVFEVSSFFNRTRSMENIQAIEDSTGWYITYDQLNHLFHSLPEFREFGRAILVRGFAALKTRMLSMITETAEKRYQALLTTNPEIFQHAALKHIASYLGITDTSLSRIRKEHIKR